MVTQQIVDKASVRGVIVQGNVTGLFQPFRAVFFLKSQQPQDCTVSQYTLRYRYVTGSGLRPDTP